MKKQNDRNFEFVDRIINIISLEKGLSKTIDWYLQNKDFFKNSKKKYFTKRLGLKI